MPIIAVILSTLLLSTLYWFFRLGGIEHLQTKSAQRKEVERLARARASEHIAPITAIEDPRDAAIVLMVLMAREGGDPTREHIATIEKIARSTFGFDRDLSERMAQARFAATRADGFAQAAALFADLFNKKLTPEEKRELLDMIEEVANFEGGGEERASEIKGLARRIGLAQAG